MKQAFLESIRYMYPEGVDDLHQMRDLIRIYSMGWCDALMHHEDKEGVEKWFAECKVISDLNWWPDDSWKWW